MTIEISTLLGKKKDNKRYMLTDRLVNNNVAVGVELEIENIEYMGHNYVYPNIFTLWKAVHDGSLRQGTEFIFDGPLKGINITDALDVMQEFLGKYKRNGSPPVISDRCSVHVHLDVTDLNKDELNNLIQVYYLVERILFQHINPLRIKNNYCRALTDSSFKYTLKHLLNNSDAYNLIYIIKGECDKYSALNVLPVSSFGSVEFRHHHGTLDMTKVLEWINIVMAIKLAAINYPIAELIGIYDVKGSVELIQTIFQGTLLSDSEVISKLTDFDEFVHRGIVDLREIHNLDQLKALNTANARKRASKNKTFLNSFKKENGFTDLMGE
jgi:hypothetical protein